MTNDLEELIAGLEEVTARMAATTCWEQGGEFGKLSESRSALCTRLLDRQVLNPVAAGRIRAVIESGNGLVARIMAMRESVLAALVEVETQRRFTRELSGTVPSQAPAHRVDIKA